MVSVQQLNEFWGENNLSRARPEALRGMNLTAEAKDFLLQVGLPVRADLLLSFQLDVAELPPVNARPGIRKIGVDEATSICIDENQGGSILSIDPLNRLPTRFVNSGVQQLAECLMIYRKHNARWSVEDLSEDEVMGLLSQFTREIESADHEALAGEEHWWSVILEQMNHGLL